MQTYATGAAEHWQNLPPEKSLTEIAQRLYDALMDVAERVSSARGYCAAVSVVHFFCPGEVVAYACGMARSTMYRKLAELREAELVDARAHYITHEGRTKADGMVWAIKVRPEVPGRVSVPYDFLKKSYRCLSADIADGRTAFKQIGQSKDLQAKLVDIDRVLSWALPPFTTENPGTGMTVRCDLEQILDVPVGEKENRNAAVDGAAWAMALTLGDVRGLMFYRWLLWKLLRLEATGQGAPWYFIYEQVGRAQVDKQEGFARRPGALFTARVKASPWWDKLIRAPDVRVGNAPVPVLAFSVEAKRHQSLRALSSYI